MEENYMSIANSVPMWIAASLAVGLALFQGVLFAMRSYKQGTAEGLTKGQMNSAMKSSLITSIGPSFVILSGLLSLLVTIGGPMAWMRLSFIGSVMFEMMAVGFATEAVGVTIGVDPMTQVALANAVWVMALGSIGWIIVATLSANSMGKLQNKISKGDPTTMKVISTAALLGSFGSLVVPHLMKLNKNTIAAVAGALIMLILSPMADKKNIKWLKEWALFFSLFGGMLVAAVIPFGA